MHLVILSHVEELCDVLLQITSGSHYILYTGNTDMRKGFDSLSGIVTNLMHFNPLNKDVYIFINRRHTQIKLLQWEGDGFAVHYKRLERGSFTLPAALPHQDYMSLTETQLQMMLAGISMQRQYRCKRYQHNPDNC